MFKWLARQYAKRIVNINVNIIVAGLVAMSLGTVPVHLSRYLGVTDDEHIKIKIIFFASDWLFDLIVVVGLHWLANHMPKRYARTRKVIAKAEDIVEDAPPPTPFLKDTALLQLQRALLSLFLSPAAWFLMSRFLDLGMARELASICSMILAICMTRVIHTIWLIRIDRRALEEWQRTKAQRLAAHTAERAAIEAKAAAKAAAGAALSSATPDEHTSNDNGSPSSPRKTAGQEKQ